MPTPQGRSQVRLPPSGAPNNNKTRNDADETITNVDASSRQRTLRLYWIVGACAVALVIMIVAVLAPILVMQNEDRSARRQSTVDERDAADDVSRSFRNDLITASSATYLLAGFVAGNMKKAPPFNASIDERIEGQMMSGFQEMAVSANSTTDNIVVMLLAPGGVVLQMAPFYESLYLKDILNSPYNSGSGFDLDSGSSSGGEDDSLFAIADFDIEAAERERRAHWAEVSLTTAAITETATFNSTANSDPAQDCSMVNWPSPSQSVRCGGVSLLGPTRVVADAMMGPHWYVNLRFPLFLSMNPANSTTSNFWGFVYCVLSVTKAVDDNDLVANMHDRHMNYLMYTMYGRLIVPISTSLPATASQKTLRAFINRATQLPVISNESVSWFIAVDSTRNENRLTVRLVLIIVLCVVLGTLLALLLAIVLIVRATAEYDGRRYAPKDVPFALLTVGPYNGKELWDLAADEMVGVTDRLNKVLEAAMVHHKAYRVQQMHPFTASYVLTRVEDAVAMGFGLLEELHRDRIDGPLVRLLGEEERLMFAFALNWCQDASIVSKEGQPLHYSGPDVLFNARMWVFAAPNTITMSSAAKQQLSHRRARISKGIKVRFLNSVFLRGVRDRQDLYNATDDSNERVREAAQIAAARVRRIRDAQQQRQQLQDLPQPRGKDGHVGLSSNHLGSSGRRTPASAPRPSDSAVVVVNSQYPSTAEEEPGVPPQRHSESGEGAAVREADQEMMRMAMASSVLGNAPGPLTGNLLSVSGGGGGITTNSSSGVLSGGGEPRSSGDFLIPMAPFSAKSGSGNGGGDVAGVASRSRVRHTRVVHPAVPHPLLYHPGSAARAADGGPINTTSASYRMNQFGLSSTSRRAPSSQRSSTDDTVSAVSEHALNSRSSRASSVSNRSPADSELGSTARSSLVGQVSGGMVVPTSVRDLERSPFSSSVLAAGVTAGTIVPFAAQLNLDSPNAVTETHRADAAARQAERPSATLLSFPTPLSPDGDGDHTAVPSVEPTSSSRLSSDHSDVTVDDENEISSPFSPPATARQVTAAPFGADAPDAHAAPSSAVHVRRSDNEEAEEQNSERQASSPSQSPLHLPDTVTRRADGRFMIARPLAAHASSSAIQARRQQQNRQLRDPLRPLPLVITVESPSHQCRRISTRSLGTPLDQDDAGQNAQNGKDKFSLSTSPLQEPLTMTHAYTEPPVTAVLVPRSNAATPNEAILTLLSSSVSSAGSGGGPLSVSNSQRRAAHTNPLSLSSRRPTIKPGEDSDNPLSGGGAVVAAAVSNTLAPAFPVVMGSASLRIPGSSGHTTPSNPTAASSLLIPPNLDTAGVGPNADEGPLTAVAAMAQSTRSASSSSSSTGRRGPSSSYVTNVTSSVAPATTSSAPRGSELVVPLIRAITHPVIPGWLDQQLRDSFEQQAVALDMSYDSLRIIIYYVYFGCKLLMRPLSAAQRTSIYRRLVGNFDVPNQSALVYLSTRCVIQFVQQHEEQHSLLWDRQLQHQEQRDREALRR